PAMGAPPLVGTAVDGAGNARRLVVSFMVDTQPPQIAIAGVSDGLVSPAPVTPVVTFQDLTLAEAALTLDGMAFVSGTPVGAEGDHRLEAHASDRAGHASAVAVAFAIDTQPPAIAIRGVRASPVGRLVPRFSVTDAHLATVTASLDGAPFASGTPVANEGAHVLAVDAADRAGNFSQRSASFILDATPPRIGV